MDDWFGLQRGLVAVGLLAVVPGCPSDKDKTTESTGTDPGSTGATDGTGTGTTGTTGDPPTGTGSGSATDSGTGTTGEPTTSGTSTSTSTTDTTTGGVDIPPVCQSYGAKYAECYMNPEGAMLAAQSCAYGIQEFAMPYGPDCVKANEDFYACLSALSCEEFKSPGQWCEAEATKIQLDCQ